MLTVHARVVPRVVSRVSRVVSRAVVRFMERSISLGPFLWPQVICTQVGAGSSLSPEALAEAVRVHVQGASVAAEADTELALQRALETARRQRSWLLVLGSFRLCGEVRRRIHSDNQGDAASDAAQE